LTISLPEQVAFKHDPREESWPSELVMNATPWETLEILADEE
jgi:hypothetical protein